MTTSVFCNKCGLIKKEKEGWTKVKYNNEELDLCPDCSIQFILQWRVYI